jgi:LPS sulfotransferase NodH
LTFSSCITFVNAGQIRARDFWWIWTRHQEILNYATSTTQLKQEEQSRRATTNQSNTDSSRQNDSDEGKAFLGHLGDVYAAWNIWLVYELDSWETAKK